MRNTLLLVFPVSLFAPAAIMLAGVASEGTTTGQPSGQVATYEVRMLGTSPPRLGVTASIPISGPSLEMTTTRPAEIPELDAHGWPGLVRNLQVFDRAGRALATTSSGESGWRLERGDSNRVTVKYEVDYSALEERHWPAQREAAFADGSHFSVVGRSLFITTRATTSIRVRFRLARPWRALAPWRSRGKSFLPGDKADLLENLIVLTRARADEIRSHGFRVLLVATGHWGPVRSEARRVLGAVIPRLVELMAFDGRENYLVVLLPAGERGGESFRSSFAMTMDAAPSRANSGDWGNTIAHEIFHYWNGWRMSGSDYAASQWFQEGFTEYAANLSMVTGGLMNEAMFRQQLSRHLRNYANLKTSLEAPGTRKGPPLYSAGALVAFSWDVLIRKATGGERNIGDFYRALWKSTDGGRVHYDWPLIRTALDATAKADWQDYYLRYIRGTERLNIDDVLPVAGLHVVRGDDDSPRVEIDPAAPRDARSLWKALARGSPALRSAHP
jgi:predicted metalloprotease with PDZ domain